MRSERDLLRWRGPRPLIGAQWRDEMQRVVILFTLKYALNNLRAQCTSLYLAKCEAESHPPAAGIEFIVLLKLMGDGSARRCFAWHTLLTKSAIIPVALMNGRPNMMLTATLGPAATRREVALPS